MKVACAEATGGTAAMWETGLGSSECTAGAVDSSVYYKGKCDNGKNQGTYTIKAYTDNTCTTEGTGTEGLATTSLPTSAYSGYTIKSCGNCPPTDVEDKTIVYIAGFFSVVLA